MTSNHRRLIVATRFPTDTAKEEMKLAAAIDVPAERVYHRRDDVRAKRKQALKPKWSTRFISLPPPHFHAVMFVYTHP
jgi:hypothetical protein